MDTAKLVSREILLAAEIIPGSVAHRLLILPIAKMPSQSGSGSERSSIRLLCPQPLTEQQREELTFLIPGFSFEFIDATHPEFPNYRELINHFSDVLSYCYPVEPEDSYRLGGGFGG
jgi:hypothetical protein